MTMLGKCPQLKSLVLHRIFYQQREVGVAEDIKVKLKKLETLDISDCNCYYALESFLNVKFLKLDLSMVCRIIVFQELY
jgi:hypothetical protein